MNIQEALNRAFKAGVYDINEARAVLTAYEVVKNEVGRKIKEKEK